MLLDLKLPSYNTIMHNARHLFNRRFLSVNNSIVSAVS